MQYRAEIDGLRALAVVPVVLFHAGFELFSGGYIGVDVFFVISGYLITSIIMDEIRNESFSIVNFYERRARRILPALYIVIFFSSILAYLWMLPDELENYGQSVFATVLFSNNILLSLTTGYWDLASEFKPLLHTWSLGVEEQYYVFFPLYLLLVWKFFRSTILIQIVLLAVFSLVLANWASSQYPETSFYLLPTRAWELLCGSLCAFYLSKRQIDARIYYKYLSLLGAILVIAPIVVFDEHTPNPSLYTAIPVLGAVLIICFSNVSDFAPRILSNRFIVLIGLTSYSAYLWHFPIFSFARIFSINELNWSMAVVLTVLTFLIAYPSWRFIEKPFRNKEIIGRRYIFLFSALCSICYLGLGLYLHKTHGLPERLYGGNSTMQEQDIYIDYNERVFSYKADTFSEEDQVNLLVIGNSFARDFVNMTIETFDRDNLRIVYRDDLSTCIRDWEANKNADDLLLHADVVIFASSLLDTSCVAENKAFLQGVGILMYYVGMKQFGYNLNWLMRLDEQNRANQENPVLLSVQNDENRLSTLIPSENYISIMQALVKDGRIPITDSKGRLLSADRVHLTKHGAKYVGERALLNSGFGIFLQRNGINLKNKISMVNPGLESVNR